MEYLFSRKIVAMLFAATFVFSAAARNDGDEWDRMIKLNSVSEKNGIYRMPAPDGDARVFVSEISAKCGNSTPIIIYSAKASPKREFVIVSKNSPVVIPGEKVSLDFSLSGEMEGVSAFVYADLDMDGVFEKRLCSKKKLKDSISAGIKIPKDSAPGKIRIRLRYTTDSVAGGADDPVSGGKCYDIVLFVVDGK